MSVSAAPVLSPNNFSDSGSQMFSASHGGESLTEFMTHMSETSHITSGWEERARLEPVKLALTV